MRHDSVMDRRIEICVFGSEGSALKVEFAPEVCYTDDNGRIIASVSQAKAASVACELAFHQATNIIDNGNETFGRSPFVDQMDNRVFIHYLDKGKDIFSYCPLELLQNVRKSMGVTSKYIGTPTASNPEEAQK